MAILAPLKSWGGLERKFTILCDEFLRQGVVPEILRIRGGDIPYPELLPKAVRTIDLDTRSKADGIPRVAGYLRNSPPDVLLTAKDHAAQVALLARGVARSPTPVFIKTTSIPSEVIRRPVQRFMAHRLYRRANGVIAISRGVVDDVTDNFGVPRERVNLIHNPMVTRDFAERCARRIDHPWFSDETGLPVIVSAGRLTRSKDFLTLIEAFARLRARRPCRLVILGDGAERPALETRTGELQIGSDVDLPGVVNDPVPFMHAAALFALSSRYEGLGNVLIEALAAGTRLVATDCPSGPREILENGCYGRLVPVGNADALAEAMGQALNEPRPDAARVRKASARFDSATVAAEYLRVLGLTNGD